MYLLIAFYWRDISPTIKTDSGVHFIDLIKYYLYISKDYGLECVPTDTAVRLPSTQRYGAIW